jgi:heat-inducible transcriptional repressor
MAELTARKGQILRIIVSDYVATAAPVPSNAVARSGSIAISPATVRNEMVALEEDGYILRPHSSAGGVPSEKGYRYFVDTLDPAALVSSHETAALQAELAGARADFDAWAEAAASAIASLAGTLAFATAPRAAAPTVKSIELLRLQDLIIMLVVILQEASVHRELITLGRPVSDSQLESVRNRLSESMAGKRARDIEAALSAAVDPLDLQVLESTAGVLRQKEADSLGGPVFQGLSLLLEQRELSAHPEQARNVVSAVEDPGLVPRLAALAPEAGRPTVLIGAEIPRGSLREFSVIVCRYGIPDEAQGLVGLVAPTRMPYDRAVPLLGLAASSLARLTGTVFARAPQARLQS